MTPTSDAGDPPARALVIVVDDDMMVLNAVRRLLEAGGFAVMPTTSAVEAARLVGTLHPDAVLTDLHMPGMNGVELAYVLHRADPDLPVVVMTGTPWTESAERARRFGAVDVLAKPVDGFAMLTSLGSAIEHRHRAR